MAADLAAARHNMVESQVRTNDVTDVRIQDAMRQIRREDFAPPGKAYLAYTDREVELGNGRVLLAPRDVAKLLHALRPHEGEKALAIAAPYAAAVLEHMGFAVERLEGEDLKAVRGKDYDLIIVEGAVARAPQAWLDALAPGGRLGVVEREGVIGRGCLYLKAEDGVGRREVFDATASILPGFEPQAGFAF